MSYGRFVLGEDFARVLRAASGGDADAFARLWRDIHPALLRYLSVTAPGTAADLARVVWLEAVRRLAKFRGGEREFRIWLFTVAHQRVAGTGRHSASAAGNVADLGRPESGGSFAGRGISTDAALAFIAALPHDEAEIIMLRVVVGLDADEAARVVGMSPDAVRAASYRGLRALSARLAGGEGPVPPGQQGTTDWGSVPL